MALFGTAAVGVLAACSQAAPSGPAAPTYDELCMQHPKEGPAA